MLRSIKELFGYSVAATDGLIGKVEDFLLDEHTGDLRYVVVDTGGWFDRHPVLVAAVAFGRPRWPARDFPVNVTRDQVRVSPALVPGAQILRGHEADLHAHYEWVPYWLTHGHGLPTAVVSGVPAPLCRLRQTLGFHLRGSDDECGHVVDFLVDDADWTARFLIAETEGWWPPRTQMVPMAAFRGVEAAEERVLLGVTAREVRESPPYDPAAIAGREHEVQYDYQGRPRV